MKIQSIYQLIFASQHPAPKVTFADGSLRVDSLIRWFYVSHSLNACFVLLETSCFHPRDFRWPDQPADKGRLVIGSTEIPVLDVVKMLIAPEMERPLFDQEIPTSKKELPEGYRLLSVVKIYQEFENLLQVAHESNQNVFGQVDEHWRYELSIGHTSGHLASYALNEAITPYWRKNVLLDSRGYADFNQLTQVKSQVIPSGCLDNFRLGKSIRKAGLNVHELIADLNEIESKANFLLKKWSESNPKFQIEKRGDALDDSRIWYCQLNDERFSMFCGGTHISHFEEVNRLFLKLEYDEQLQQIQSIVTME